MWVDVYTFGITIQVFRRECM